MAKTLTKNVITVTINGKDYSKYVQFPFKVSQLLDEQLDEACLMLVGVPDKIFKPLTDVTVTLTNDNKKKSYHMLVANDKSDEIPTGSEIYKHELYLIEQTKYLECFIVRSIGFVNLTERNLSQVASIPNGEVIIWHNLYFDGTSIKNIDINKIFNPFLTPQYGSIYVYGLRTDTNNKGLILPEGDYGDKGKRVWHPCNTEVRYDTEDVIPEIGIQIYDIDNKLVWEKLADFSYEKDEESNRYKYKINLENLANDVIVLLNPGFYTVKYIDCLIMPEDESDQDVDNIHIDVTYSVVVL